MLKKVIIPKNEKEDQEKLEKRQKDWDYHWYGWMKIGMKQNKRRKEINVSSNLDKQELQLQWM